MNRNRRLVQDVLSLAVFCGAFLLFAGCQTVPPASDTVLRVGVTANFPPYISQRGSRYVGLEAEFASSLAKELGRDLYYVDLKWDQLLPSLGSGKIDMVMSGMTITESRLMLASFPPAYMESGQVMLVRLKDARRFAHPRVLLITQEKVGVEGGTTGDLMVQRNCRKAERKTYQSLSSACDALINEKVSVVVGDAPVLMMLAATREADGIVVIPIRMTREQLGWAIDKANPALIGQVEDVYERWVKNGTIDKALTRWIPGYVPLSPAGGEFSEARR